MLKEDDENVTRAQRLRDYVTHELLPPNRMYIVGKHPQSLLRDVDRTILHARMRLVQKGKTFDEVAEAPRIPSLRERKNAISQRYSYAHIHQEQKQFNGFIWLTVAACTAVLAMILIKQYMGANELYNSFGWIPK
ncbi:MAG: hypothetical protein GC154_00825 [bacterium]|nr:hypothetical protein [bacterium]